MIKHWARITLREVTTAAVFLDRDGTISEEVGYVNHPSRLRVLPRAAEAVRRLNQEAVPAVLVTNQSGIARGYFSADVLSLVNASLIDQLSVEGAHLAALYICSHHPREGEPPYRLECDCRKPKPGMLLKAASDLGLDLARSWTVGDKPSDIVAGHRAGTRTILVLTGYGLGEWEYRRGTFSVQPDHVAEDLLDAVSLILGERHDSRSQPESAR